MLALERTMSVPADRRLRLDLLLPDDIQSDTITVLVYDNAPNGETLAAMQEARDILSGKIQTKSYASAEELIADIETEIREEESARSC